MDLKQSVYWTQNTNQTSPVNQLSKIKTATHTHTNIFWHARSDLFQCKLYLHKVCVHINPSLAQTESATSTESNTSVLLYDSVIVL